MNRFAPCPSLEFLKNQGGNALLTYINRRSQPNVSPGSLDFYYGILDLNKISIRQIIPVALPYYFNAKVMKSTCSVFKLSKQGKYWNQPPEGSLFSATV